MSHLSPERKPLLQKEMEWYSTLEQWESSVGLTISNPDPLILQTGYPFDTVMVSTFKDHPTPFNHTFTSDSFFFFLPLFSFYLFAYLIEI